MAPAEISDAEAHDSIAQARDAFRQACDREVFVDPQHLEGRLFLYDPRGDDVHDPYPDRILTLGPRGGVQMLPA